MVRAEMRANVSILTPNEAGLIIFNDDRRGG